MVSAEILFKTIIIVSKIMILRVMSFEFFRPLQRDGSAHLRTITQIAGDLVANPYMLPVKIFIRIAAFISNTFLSLGMIAVKMQLRWRSFFI